MDAFQHLMAGLGAAMSPGNLMFAFAGCMLGTLIGLLPGLGPAAGTAILIPLTFSLDATGAIIMLCAIYYGAMYGGTITSVLINVPGEAASVITCIDGYAMARQGRAGSALAIAAIGSFVGGTAATIALVVVAIPLAQLALKFGPAEFFGLMVAGLCLVIGLAGKNLLAALLMTVLGLLLAMIGLDPVRGAPRFTFGLPELYDGIGFIPVVMGLFGIGELLIAAERRETRMIEADLKKWNPTKKEWRASAGAIGRGTIVGFVLGLIPGVGAIVPTFMAYVLEKRVSKTPERFGNGAIEGVASAETANNAYANASMVPLLALGVPSSPTIAVLMGAFIVNGITPGPFLFTERPELVWTVIASFFVGNAILLILNLPLVGLWAKLLKIPFSYMCTGVLIFCVIGAYGLKQSLFDVWIMLGFGVLGYLLRKLDLPLAPAILALILGPMMERSLRTTLEISAGSFAIFLDRPLALALLAVPVLVLGFMLLKPRAFAPVRQADAE
ncbi:tripartite tricarboxylate transporter permease [Reyranella sp.]|uniref:tripartite tricarboxylate transporter permease n=1 Tax=Reyranella sp. TaxID=1929291 RepID=UPI003D0F97DC